MKNSALLIILCSIALLAFYFSLNIGDSIFSFVPPDTNSYINASNMLYDDLIPHPTRPFGYALITGFPKLIWNDFTTSQYITFSVILNILAWMGSILLFYKSLKLYFSTKASFLFTILQIFTLSGLAHVFWMLTEPLIILGLSLITYHLLLYDKSRTKKHLILSAAILNILIVIKPGFYYLGILASIALIVYLVYTRKSSKVGRGIALFVISIFLVLIQNVAMYKEYGKMTTSFIDKITWYHYLGAEISATVKDLPLETIKKERRLNLSEKTFLEQNEICTDDLKHLASNYPGIMLKHWANNIIHENSFTGSTILEIIFLQNENTFLHTYATKLYNITKYQNALYIIFFLFSLLMIIRSLLKPNVIILILASIVFYTIVTSGISYSQGDRFHCIIYPTITIVFLLISKDKLGHRWSQFLAK